MFLSAINGKLIIAFLLFPNPLNSETSSSGQFSTLVLTFLERPDAIMKVIYSKPVTKLMIKAEMKWKTEGYVSRY